MKHTFLLRIYSLAFLLLGSSGLFASAETAGMRQVRANSEKAAEFNALSVNWKASEEDKSKAAKAWSTISQWLAEGKGNSRKLHVVYVTLKDRPALEGYKERLDRIAKNIQKYYADQMEENGYPPLTFALDMDKEGRVIVHDAFLDRNMEELDVQSSGPPSRAVAETVLKQAGIDPSKNYMLVVVQMPDKKGPYYGMGTSEFGCCWICDIPHVDTKNLASQQSGDYRFGTLGEDSTVYIGGTAHELGHCFSLPHTATTPGFSQGTSLMGSGNYTYGQELRGKGKGSYLIQSDALRLASIALFSGKERRFKGAPQVVFSDFKAKPVPGGFNLTGKVENITRKESPDQPPVYGLVAYYDPAGGSDYDATSCTCIPDADGSFNMDVVRPGYKGVFEFRLVALLANGRTETWASVLRSDGETVSDVFPLTVQGVMADVFTAWKASNWKEAQAALVKVKDKYGKDTEWINTIKIWEEALNPKWGGPKGIKPAAVEEGVKKMDLTKAEVTEAASGWWSPFWNGLPPNELGPVPVFNAYEPGRFMFSHAKGKFSYDLGGKWKEFSAFLGIPASRGGKIFFTIKADGKEVFKSRELTEGETEPVKLNVEGVSSFTIEIDKAPGQSDAGNWGIVCDPVLTR